MNFPHSNQEVPRWNPSRGTLLWPVPLSTGELDPGNGLKRVVITYECVSQSTLREIRIHF